MSKVLSPTHIFCTCVNVAGRVLGGCCYFCAGCHSIVLKSPLEAMGMNKLPFYITRWRERKGALYV